jgi:aminoglycoside/choline kinase family phosphotransferase
MFFKVSRMQQQILLLTDLYTRAFAKNKIVSVTPLARSGSARQYFRIVGHEHSVIGVYNENRKENNNFIVFSKHFLENGIPVPVILAQDLKNHVYIINDLGNETLFNRMEALRKNESDFSNQLLLLYQQAIDWLLKIQFSAGQNFDYSMCYPRQVFDKQSMMWDLEYFKYCFLKLAHIPFDEQGLEYDFDTLTDFLSEASSAYFLYRDFQSRNIMLCDDELYFIDYQGGKKGALPYDLASLLYDGKANLSPNIREELLRYYIYKLTTYSAEQARIFEHYYYGYVFIRIMQAMGAYGYRGFYEQKKHFLHSIPYALKSLEFLLNTVNLPVQIPTLQQIFEQLITNETLRSFGKKRLRIVINSFSYQKGYPLEKTEHGGGFVFDCRFLPNPGRYPQFQNLNGKDASVQYFFDREPFSNQFFINVSDIIDKAIENYLQREFEHLSIHFGCTGGKHRSVYFAERLKTHILRKYPVEVNTTHTMQEYW